MVQSRLRMDRGCRIKEYGGYAWMLLKYGRIIKENVTAAAVEELRNNIKVKNRDSYVFHLYVRDKYPERAALITDRLGKILANWLLEFDRQPGRMRQEQLQTLLEEKNQANAAATPGNRNAADQQPTGVGPDGNRAPYRPSLTVAAQTLASRQRNRA